MEASKIIRRIKDREKERNRKRKGREGKEREGNERNTTQRKRQLMEGIRQTI